MDSLLEFSNFNLSGKRLFSFPEKAIRDTESSYQSLKADFSCNNFSHVPAEISNFPFIEELMFSQNLLSSVANLSSLRFLSVLDLSHNRLTSIEPVCQLNSLKVLNVGFNQLTVLPPKIGQLQLLEEVNFESNHLNIIRDSFFELQSLRVICFKNNTIRSISKSICKLQALEVLDLSFNYLTMLDTSLSRLSALRHLCVAHNPLTFPPAAVCHLGLEAIKHCLKTAFTEDDVSPQPSQNTTCPGSPLMNSDRFDPETSSLISEGNLFPESEPSDVRLLRILFHRKLSLDIPPTISFYDFISDGIALCKLVKKYDKEQHFQFYLKPSDSTKLTPRQRLFNVSNFIKYCEKHLNITDKVCSSQQLLSGNPDQQVIDTIFALLEKMGETLSTASTNSVTSSL